MTSATRALLFWSTLVVAAPAAAQPVPVPGHPELNPEVTVKVGDGTISGKYVWPSQATYHVTFFPVDGKPIIDGGIWEEQLRLIDYSGKKALMRTTGAIIYGQQTREIRGYIAHVTLLDPETLAPMWSEHDVLGSSEKWIFNGNHVEWRSKGPKANDKEVIRSFDTPVPAYDFSGPIIPLYLGAQQLKVGKSGVIPEVGDPDHPLKGLPYRVVRWERVSAGRYGIVDALVIECPFPGGGLLHFWFTRKLPFPVKMVIPSVDGTPSESYDLIG